MANPKKANANPSDHADEAGEDDFHANWEGEEHSLQGIQDPEAEHDGTCSVRSRTE